MGKTRVIIRSVADRPLDEAVSAVFSFCNVPGSIGPGTKVLIKPNLCTERIDMKHTANTSLALIESVVKHIRDITPHITIGEGDGARYTVEQAYENNGIYDLVKRYGVEAVNFSNEEQVWVPNETLGKWGFARRFLETDFFITLPALKTHATTVFTGCLKNQWGCVPRRDRLIWHKHLDGLLCDIARLVPVRLAIMDGIVGMQGRGPINGYPINANVVVGGVDEVAVDATSMRLIGLDPYSSGHVRLAAERGIGAIAEQDIEIDGDLEKHRVAIEPAVQDWAIKLLNFFSRSEFITKTFIMNDHLFYPVRSVVVRLRRMIG
jgi:uncharacterized protein (DUF362 family)